MSKYLDLTGLTRYDGKIKDYIDTADSAKVPYTGATSNVSLGNDKSMSAGIFNVLGNNDATKSASFKYLYDTTSAKYRINLIDNTNSKTFILPPDESGSLFTLATQSYVSGYAYAKSDVYTKTEVNNKGYITKSVSNLDNYYTKTNTYSKTEVDNTTGGLGTRISALENAGYITKSVNNLTNYYTKDNVYTKTEVANLISGAQFRFLKVESLEAVTTPDTATIYLVETGYQDDGYAEYYYDETYDRFELLGTSVIQLEDYVPKTTQVNGHALTGNITVGAGDIAFGSSTSYNANTVGAAIQGKVDKVSGKGLSANDFTSTLKTKLDGIATGAQVNVLESVAINGRTMTISSKGIDIPISVNGDASNFYWDSDGATFDIFVPTKVSDLTNDSHFITGVSSITSAEIDALFS